jgi:hypothetical protein
MKFDEIVQHNEEIFSDYQFLLDIIILRLDYLIKTRTVKT